MANCNIEKSTQKGAEIYLFQKVRQIQESSNRKESKKKINQNK